MLKSIPFILLASATINLTDIDNSDNHFTSDSSTMMAEDIAKDTHVVFTEPRFDNILNQYTVEDLNTFSPEDLIESDIIVYDEAGNTYTGTIQIQDFEGSGIIEDDLYNEQEILISFSPEGNLIVCSEHVSSMKIEVLNYRISEMSLSEF